MSDVADVDWKTIAKNLARCVKMTIDSNGRLNNGVVFNWSDDSKPQHWKDRFADALEAMPGVTVNRELLHKKGKCK